MVKCNFTEQAKRLMFDAIKRSEKQRKISGFNLCLDSDDKIIPGSFVEGGKENIKMTNSSCPQSTKKIGDFYTQLMLPGPLPSDLDILRQMTSGNKLLCIGTTGKFQNEPITREVTCFEVKDVKEDELTEIRKVVSKKLPVLDKMKFMKQFLSTKCTIKE